MTIKMKKINRNKINKFYTHFELYTRQSCLACTYLSQRLFPPILTTTSPQYLLSCFPFIFLESYHSTLSSKEMLVTSLYLDPVIWEASMSSKRVVCSQPKPYSRIALDTPTALFSPFLLQVFTSWLPLLP